MYGVLSAYGRHIQIFNTNSSVSKCYNSMWNFILIPILTSFMTSGYMLCLVSYLVCKVIWASNSGLTPKLTFFAIEISGEPTEA